MIVWFTGKPCSGKTTIAKALQVKLDDYAYETELLDGDVLRDSPFSKGIGFSKEEREIHLLRVGYMAQILHKHGIVSLCSFVSPYEDVINKINPHKLVYVKASSEECAKRDVKGMWAKAKAGEIKGFTGYDAPFEEPEYPDLVLNTEELTLEECVDEVFNLILIHDFEN
jgi:adenylylsulfate kinase